MATALEILQQTFGFDSFRPLQKRVIDDVCAGQDAFVLMPTGGGKSLCYQIPALVRPGVALIVSPLISLMKDQVDALKASGVRAACYNSSLSADEGDAVLRALHADALDVLYVAPERLLNEGFLARLSRIEIALIAVDEAHCVSQWGHDFRPEYTKLGQVRQHFPNAPLLALTATADEQTRRDIQQHLGLNHVQPAIAGFDRPNIRYIVEEKNKPFDQLRTFLGQRPLDSGIIYALSRKKVDEVARKLRDYGVDAAAYHAGHPDAERTRVQEAFLRDDLQVVVATVAFGMGIDKSNVRFVVHYDLPRSVESYYQETGRAGRDGLDSEALLLYGPGDIVAARTLIERGGNAEQNRVELHKLNAMAAFAEAQSCRRQVLLGYFGEKLDKGCGNCDTCLNPPEFFDATEAARKALSCVYRVGQRFGTGHVIDVLRGSESQRITQLGHDQLSTYGIGAEMSKEEWGSIFRQLIHRGFLKQDITAYSVLKLTEESRPLLRGEMELTLAKPRIKVRAAKKPVGAMKYDKGLFNQLRQVRKTLAEEEGVPPFVIFSDATLAEMAVHQPLDDATLLQISGIGPHKLTKYGEAFLAVIREECGNPALQNPSLTDTLRATLRLVLKDLSLEEMVEERRLTSGTLVGHLEKLHHLGEPLSLHTLLRRSHLSEIEDTLNRCGWDTPWEALSEALPEQIRYDEVRLVRVLRSTD